MTNVNEESPEHTPPGISHHPLYRPVCVVYWIFVGAVITKVIGAAVGFWDYPDLWTYYASFGPALVFVFFAILEDMIVSAVYEGTKLALIELIEHMDDEMPTAEDEERIAELYHSEPAGRA